MISLQSTRNSQKIPGTPGHFTQKSKGHSRIEKRIMEEYFQSSGIVSSWDTSSQIRVRAWMGMLGSLEISSILDMASAARSPMAFVLFVRSVRVSSATRRIFRGIELSSCMCCSIRIQFSIVFSGFGMVSPDWVPLVNMRNRHI